MKNWLFSNLANFITAIRLVGSIWLAILIKWGEVKLGTLILLLICILSDLVDGKVARKLGIESQAGAFLDRLADKVFIVLLMIVLAIKGCQINVFKLGFFSLSLVVAAVLLEIILLLSGILGLFLNLSISANKWGKRKMVFQSLAVVFWFLFLFFLQSSAELVLAKGIFFLANFFLFCAIVMATKSLEGYFLRWKGGKEDN